MRDDRLKKLAKQVVNYSVGVKKGDNVYISAAGYSCDPFVQELIEEILIAGGIPHPAMKSASHSRLFLMGMDEERMKAYTEIYEEYMGKMDCYISVSAGDNKFELSDVPTDQMKLFNQTYVKKVVMEGLIPKSRWVVLGWPNASMAQNASKSLRAFEDFYFDVCSVDYAKMSVAMNPLVELMNKTDKVRIVAPGTDLSFSIKDIPTVKCDGKMNVPDGEIYTAPVKDSVNGVISYNTPSMHEGVKYDGIRFEFKDGKIVKAECKDDNEKFQAIFNVDEGARFVGEFAIGVNPYVMDPMLDILFDEKIAGSIHFTPGNSYKDAYNGNNSSLHWDLVQIQRPEYGGGEIWFDDVLIRKDGLFVLDSLLGLNPENLK